MDAGSEAARQRMDENLACFEALDDSQDADQPVPTQTLSQLTAEAEACYEQTEGSDSELPSIIEHVSPVAEVRSTAPWWALRIVQLTSTVTPPAQQRPWNVISGCSGLSAESWALKARVWVHPPVVYE